MLGYHKHSKKGTASSATIASILLAWIVGKRCLQEEPEVDSEQVAKSIGSATIVASFHDARVDNACPKECTYNGVGIPQRVPKSTENRNRMGLKSSKIQFWWFLGVFSEIWGRISQKFVAQVRPSWVK